MAGVTRNGGARKAKEMKDLLNLWGEVRVQEVLWNHHRNIDIFESIAKGLVERGYIQPHCA